MVVKLNGIIKGNQIALEGKTGLRSGTPVTVTVTPRAKMSVAEKRRRLRELFKELGQDASFIKALEGVVEQRSEPREVDLDAAP